jgi:hypothetical protein
VSNAKWLISYRYRARFWRTADGGSSSVSAVDTIEVIDVHPAVFVANSKIAMREIDGKRPTVVGKRLPDTIERVYFAMEIPAGTLTAEQEDALS